MTTLNKPLVLSIDLDEAFIGASESERAELVHLFEASEDSVHLVYTSHGGAEDLISMAAKAQMPVPDMFLADTGTTALKGDGSGTIEPLQRNIIQLWPGKEAVQKGVGEIEGVKLLEDAAPCRQSVEISTDEAYEAVRAKVDSLGCSVELREGDVHDILPYGVDKGASLGRWVVQENVPPSQLIAFTAAAGDYALFGRGWRGAVFPSAPEELRTASGRFHNVKLLEHDGARGVLDALQHFGWLEMSGTA